MTTGSTVELLMIEILHGPVYIMPYFDKVMQDFHHQQNQRNKLLFGAGELEGDVSFSLIT